MSNRAQATGTTTRRVAVTLPPERPELVADEVDRRYEHDRDRLRQDLPDAHLDESPQGDEVRGQREQRHDQEAHALVAEVPAVAPERPVAVPPVVVRHRDEKGSGRRPE